MHPVTLVTPVPPGLCRKKRSAGEKPGGIPLRNPYCLSVASLRILGISPGFSAFGGSGPRLFVTFVAMTKVKPRTKGESSTKSGTGIRTLRNSCISVTPAAIAGKSVPQEKSRAVFRKKIRTV